MPTTYKIDIRAARINAKMSREAVAERLGVNRDTLGSWERGETEPNFSQMEQLCSIYGVPITNIFLPKATT